MSNIFTLQIQIILVIRCETNHKSTNSTDDDYQNVIKIQFKWITFCSLETRKTDYGV